MAFKSSSAESPVTKGVQYHIRLKPGDIPPYLIIPGDPARVKKIASVWDKSEEVAFNREYRTMKGEYQGAKLACTSSGIGSPALSIAVEELVKIGVKTFVRVGTCGGIQEETRVGDLVITTGAVRLDGASKDFVIPEYPAVANYEVVSALVKAAKKLKVRYHVGITASTDTFFLGQGRSSVNGYQPSHKANIFKDMQKAKVKNFEMEAGCLLTLASVLGVRAGAVCVVAADRVRNKFEISDEMETRAAKVATEAIRILQRENKN